MPHRSRGSRGIFDDSASRQGLICTLVDATALPGVIPLPERLAWNVTVCAPEPAGRLPVTLLCTCDWLFESSEPSVHVTVAPDVVAVVPLEASRELTVHRGGIMTVTTTF